MLKAAAAAAPIVAIPVVCSILPIVLFSVAPTTEGALNGTFVNYSNPNDYYNS